MPLSDLDSKQKRREYMLRYHAAHPEQRRASFRKWQRTHRQDATEYQDLWRKKNYERFRTKASAAERNRYAANPEKHKEKVREWQKTHPENVRHIKANREARQRGAEGSHNLMEWQFLLLQSGYACTYCGRTDRPLTRDHVIPITRGGSNFISNIVPACRSCNSRKGNRT